MFSSLSTDPQDPAYFYHLVNSIPDMITWVSTKLDGTALEYQAWRSRSVRVEDRILVRTMTGVNLVARLDPYRPEEGPERDLYLDAFSRADFDRMFRATCSYWIPGLGQLPSRQGEGGRIAYAKIKFRGVIWQLSRDSP